MRGSTAGISDGLKGSSHIHYLFLTTLDHLISSVIISPLVISYWRGTWGSMDYFVFSKNPRYSSAVSIVVGYLGTMLFTVTQKYHRKILHPDLHWLSYYFVSRVYTACFGLICVNSWRGVWMALDLYTSVDSKTVASITFISVILLAVSHTLRNVSASPFTIVTDRYEGYFDVPTLLQSGTENLWMYILDCTYSICVVGTLVVFVWRGAWCLLDMFLYPSQPEMSAWASLGIGYSLVLVSFGLQPAMKYLAKVLTGVWRLIAVDVYLLFSFCGMINVWRGIWNLLNVYFLPDMPHLSNILTHAFSFLLLVLINSSNSILVRGVYVDAQEDGEQCVDFPCYYIRLFFQSRQKKKFLSESEKNLKERRKSEAAETLIQMGAEKTVIVVPNHTDAITNAV
ncbi:uncharacterized protein LOC106667066 isoform X1 [Cimex lectularius]|uniref:Fuseless n=1 Tax=Cimex lectularius TaxID=79782 RepID=A0A8I6RRF6_CIMLE|nr:uncharacterized protein LOC106667066 isoform X1 [Cimex lectularius]